LKYVKNRTKCHVLKHRAIENYFTDRVVKSVNEEKYSVLQPYQNVCGRNTIIKRYSHEINLKKLEGTDIGDFLKAR